MRVFIFLFVFLSGSVAFAQDFTSNEERPRVKIDSLYREDQFYIGITYNTMVNGPKDYSKDKISTGFTGGFLRDMPVNKNRTYAIAILGDGTYSTNRFTTLTADLPIELRWRASTFESTKFWRIYAGFKLSYLVYDRNVYDATLANIIIRNNTDLNKFGYGVYLASGYNTFNVYVHYGVNSLFKSGQVGTEKVQLRSLNLGLIFYIL